MELVVDNVNEAFSEIFWKFKVLGLKPQETRNGPALVYPGVVTTTYRYPEERVLFDPHRDANPIFHLMEAIWMIAGRKDVGFVSQFNKNMANFSDDGRNFNAAYGWRWRQHFGHDQLIDVINLLRTDPSTRQAVVQMWDSQDLYKKTIDKACNTQIVFQIIDDKVVMTVFNRSNDIWWGAYGANAVHFSFLQEFVARSLGLKVGVYNQISVNFHLYTELYNIGDFLTSPPSRDHDAYNAGEVSPYPIMKNMNMEGFLRDCENFCNLHKGYHSNYTHPFFNEVALPMAHIYRERKEGVSDGYHLINDIAATDWKLAVSKWIERRQK
tara:strand:+ start:621 stop:1595 length:975 start_codon:yes stop_codon:yes gene_type:complete